MSCHKEAQEGTKGSVPRITQIDANGSEPRELGLKARHSIAWGKLAASAAPGSEPNECASPEGAEPRRVQTEGVSPFQGLAGCRRVNPGLHPGLSNDGLSALRSAGTLHHSLIIRADSRDSRATPFAPSCASLWLNLHD